MLRSSVAIGLLVTCFALTTSFASVNVDREWKDPSLPGSSYRSVMVLCACPDTIAARILEDAVVRYFSEKRIEAQPAYQVVGSREGSEDELRDALHSRGIDAIVLASMTGVEDTARYVSGYWYTVPETRYNSFYNRFWTAYRQVYQPGYFEPYQVLHMQADVYDERSGKLVTSLSTSQVKSEDVNDDMKEFAKKLVGQLERLRMLA